MFEIYTVLCLLIPLGPEFFFFLRCKVHSQVIIEIENFILFRVFLLGLFNEP